MPAAIDITGLRFGRLTAKEKVRPRGKRSFWRFECDCGAEKEIDSAHVRYGRIVSCGCYLKELLPEVARKHLLAYCGQNKTHGRSKDPVYMVWKAMRQRCNNPCSADYKYYGALGVKVCKRWSRFDNFIADMGERPEGMTIERVDTNGDYEPKNCIWATWIAQNRNKRARYSVA